jgi:hypothetical protein
MAMEAPARLSLTNDAPLTAAPAIAARPVAEAAIARRAGAHAGPRLVVALSAARRRPG